jgi:hypothetical protein
MYKRLYLLLALALFGSALLIWARVAQKQTTTNQEVSRPTLWAAVGVDKPIYHEGYSGMQMYFTIVNDGNTVGDPNFDSSRLIVNGREDDPVNQAIFCCGGVRSIYDRALPPGKSLEYGYPIDLKKPGIYRIVWKGKGFESLPIEFRILPCNEGNPCKPK